ncbi:hypothetical protein PHMEG_00018570, partial [Phytophthora megakarya]
NIPTHAVSAVFKNKLRPRFIGPFKVVAKKGLAYMLNLPKKMRTHPVFYVGLLKPYGGPAIVSFEALAPSRMDAAKQQAPAPQGAGAQGAARQQSAEAQEAARQQVAEAQEVASEPTGPVDPADEQPDAQGQRSATAAPEATRTSPRDVRCPRNQPVGDGSHDQRGECALSPSRRSAACPLWPHEGPVAARPPPVLLDEHGELHYHVERLMARRHRPGHNQYLITWRGYPHSQNSWEFEVPLRQDCPDVVDAYDRVYPMPGHPEGVQRGHRTLRASHH